MGFSFNKGDGFDLNQEFLDDMDTHVEFHKDKFLTEDIEVVDQVLKTAFMALLESLPPDAGEGILPMLSAIGETIVELRTTNEVLRMELLEKYIPPPPDGFEFN